MKLSIYLIYIWLAYLHDHTSSILCYKSAFFFKSTQQFKNMSVLPYVNLVQVFSILKHIFIIQSLIDASNFLHWNKYQKAQLCTCFPLNKKVPLIYNLKYSCWIMLYIYLYLLCGEGNGTPLQYSCLENPMDGGAW